MSVNRVVIVGNLTQDPELRPLPSGTSVCHLRLAFTTRRRDQTDEFVAKPNYIDVSVWGASAEACARYLGKGRPVAVDGRLEWREWTTAEGQRRDSVQIQADQVQFLGSSTDRPSANGATEMAMAAAENTADDIPF